VNPFGVIGVHWRHRDTGEVLVAVATEPIIDSPELMVLPIRPGRTPHPFDRMPEASFLRSYEAVVA
jgi:hypothetical protein